ncbi:MAG: hypothetical protein ACRDNW_13050 [Trebonia sp.]
MIRRDLKIMAANALTGVQVPLFLLRWPALAILHRDPGSAIRSLVARQRRIDALALGLAEPDPVPANALPWLLCQAVLGPGVLLLSGLMWAGALFMVSAPLWWRLASQNPLPGLVVKINNTGDAIIVALLGLLLVLIAAACGHGLPRWHASINRLLRGCGTAALPGGSLC